MHAHKHGQEHKLLEAFPCQTAWAQTWSGPYIASRTPMQHSMGRIEDGTPYRLQRSHATLHGTSASSALMQGSMGTNRVRTKYRVKHSHSILHGHKHGQNHASQDALPCKPAWAQSWTVPYMLVGLPYATAWAPPGTRPCIASSAPMQASMGTDMVRSLQHCLALFPMGTF